MGASSEIGGKRNIDEASCRQNIPKAPGIALFLYMRDIELIR
jgi:hypothetical protein